jgi:hypothetical protein
VARVWALLFPEGGCGRHTGYCLFKGFS